MLFGIVVVFFFLWYGRSRSKARSLIAKQTAKGARAQQKEAQKICQDTLELLLSQAFATWRG